MIQSSSEIITPSEDFDYIGVVDISPVPRYLINTHDPITQDQHHHVSAAVHHEKTVPWDSNVWDKIVALTQGSALEKDSSMDRVFVDVGANIGYFSLAAAALGYKVVAFEPTSIHAKKLAKSIELNTFEHPVTLYQNTVSDVGDHGENTVALSDILDGMDAYILKIDVEEDGDATKVLSGAKQWIHDRKVQHIIMKLSDSNSHVSEMMNEAGYEMKDEGQNSTLGRDILFSLKE